jgi:hypothetical protein
LISDADVLIDFVEADIEVIELLATDLWDLYVAPPTLSEVKGLSVSAAEDIGLMLCDACLPELQAAAVRGGPLSQRDKLCLAIAKNRGWGCWTNDTTLRRECKKHNVKRTWGLEALLVLYNEQMVTKKRALQTAQAIHRLNPRHINVKVLSAFKQKLQKLSEKHTHD